MRLRAPREAFDSVRVSPSRVNTYLACGQQFRMKYIEDLPEQASGSAALFGSVLHEALEHWAINRKEQSLVTLVSNAWKVVTEGTPVIDFIGAYQHISVRAMHEEKRIRDEWAAKGKESKAPRMTKAFKESDVGREINQLLAIWIPKLDAESPWRFSEHDPLPKLYDESLVLAKKYAIKWGHLPNALVTEFAFDCEWRGFVLNGYIDTIEPLIERESGELRAYLIGDYKSYAKEAPEQKDWRQMCMYDVAVADLIARGALDLDPDLPVIVFADYLRLLHRKYWEMGEADHQKLYEELTMYRTGVEAGVFLPANKNQNPDFCSYPENCCLVTKGDGLGCRVEMSQEID